MYYILMNDDKSGLASLEMIRSLMAQILVEARRQKLPIKRGPGRFEYLIWNTETASFDCMKYRGEMSQELHSFVIKLIEGNYSILFECLAESFDHAIEQSRLAHPDAEIEVIE